jgi:hypothetical protein
MNDRPIPNFIRRLMPTATDAELHSALENYERYLRAVRRIIKRTKQQEFHADSPDFTSGHILDDDTPTI